MNKLAMLYSHLIKAALITASLTGAVAISADQSDFAKEISIVSESQFLDGKNKISIFKDNVYITQGSMEIRADELEVIATEGDGREIFIARGNPAVYAQNMDDGSRVSAQANTITYEVMSRAITLDGNAQLVRDTSLVEGDLIQFDMEKEQLVAQSNNSGQDRRVTTIFRPEAFTESQKQDEGKDTPEDEGNPF